MSPRFRRLAAAGLAGAVLLTLVVASRPADPPVASFRVILGINDKAPTDWSGQVAVTGGEAVALRGWRFEAKDAVDGATKWKCQTRDFIVPGDHYPLDPANGRPKPPPQEPWPNGVVLTVRGAGPTVTLTLPPGEVKFTADDVPLGRPKTYLNGQVRVERLPAFSVLRPPAPPRAPRPRRGRLPRFLGALQDRQAISRPGSLIRRRKTASCWSSATGRTANGRSRSKWPGRAIISASPWPALHGDTLWIVWSSQRDHNLGSVTAALTRTANSARRCG